jgi:hypothetical protein
MRSFRCALALLAVALAVAACDSKTEEVSSTAAAPAAASPHLLKADLLDAVPVLDAVKKESGSAVTVVGRVSGVAKGTITIVDDSLDYCGRGESTDDTCITPWDYCCTNPRLLADATLVVRMETPDGKPVPKAEMGLRPLDLVALRGKLEKNEKGHVSLVAANGWFRRERPIVGAHVKFSD